MESAPEAAGFRKQMRSPHPFISDPHRTLYGKYGVQKGTVGQLINLRTAIQAVRAAFSGVFQGKPTSDPSQLGGCIVLDEHQQVVWQMSAKTAADIVTEQQLREALDRLD